MSPTIILEKHFRQVKMVVGASGGTKITTAVAQVILDYMFFDFDVQKAVNEPRVHNQLNPNTTFVEGGFDENVTDGLKLKNHIINKMSSVGKVQAVTREENKICTASDPKVDILTDTECLTQQNENFFPGTALRFFNERCNSPEVLMKFKNCIYS